MVGRKDPASFFGFGLFSGANCNVSFRGGIWYSPENQHGSPENHPFEKEIHLNQTSMTLVSMRIFQGSYLFIMSFGDYVHFKGFLLVFRVQNVRFRGVYPLYKSLGVFSMFLVASMFHGVQGHPGGGDVPSVTER